MTYNAETLILYSFVSRFAVIVNRFRRNIQIIPLRSTNRYGNNNKKDKSHRLAFFLLILVFMMMLEYKNNTSNLKIGNFSYCKFNTSYCNIFESFNTFLFGNKQLWQIYR